MKIEWLEIQLEIEVVTVVDDYDDEIVSSCVETIFRGEEDIIDILEDKGDTVDIQFEDGSCAYGVKKEWFKVI